MTERPFCRVYWGSHGCDLETGHAEPWHLCADDREHPCSRIDWSDEEGLWVCRFADPDGSFEQSKLYPWVTFGEDLPAEFDVPDDRYAELKQKWIDDGRLPVWEDGKWVYRKKSSLDEPRG